MKVALIYDRVNKFGGAERVLLALHKIFPDAPLYTSVYNPETAPWAKVFKTVPSFLQKFPFAKSNHEFYAPLMPLAFESFNFDDYDIVISITSESAKSIITKPKTLHICYCLTPTRYLWSGHEEYFENSVQRLASRGIIKYLKHWDKIAAQRPDEYIAISKTVAERIKKYYGRESEIVYPPVDTDKFEIRNQKFETNTKYKIQNTKYFLVVSRLVKYKKVDLVIKAFNELGWNLKIIGTGREMGNLRGISKNNIEFLGNLTDEELLSYYQNCEAIIFPQEEDFGIVPLEAQACGKSVIAFKAGGALETVIENKTGLFFEKQTVECLVGVLKGFEGSPRGFTPRGFGEKVKPIDCRKQAERFSEEIFIKEFKKKVEEKWMSHQKNTYTL